MNKRLASVFLFALIVSGVASLLVYNFVIARVASASVVKVPRKPLLVAAHKLETGALLTAEDLRIIQVADALPEGIINDKAQLIGRGVLAPIYPNEPFNTERIAEQGAGAGLASMIPVGKRAVALRVNDVVGLAGFVLPGMRVDVIVSSSAGSAETGTISKTILQNIEVLSAGHKIEKRVDGKPEEAQVVNLLVTPAQAETLSLASNETRVQLVLRNPLDKEESKTSGTSVAAMLGVKSLAPRAEAPAAPVAQAAPAAVTPKAPPADSVEIFSGSKRSDQSLDH